MAHVVPTIVGLVISGLTTLSPWTAPRTDWAGWSQSQYRLELRGAMYHTTNPFEEWSPNVTQLLRLFKICRDPRLLTWC